MAKISRDAFLYLDPEPGVDNFAQCLTCRDWIEGDDLCAIHGESLKVTDTMSCGFYVYGNPHGPGTEAYYMVSPKESGLVDRKVRCENCRHMLEENICGFFKTLNETLPDLFNLDISIDPRGCCNAQQP